MDIKLIKTTTYTLWLYLQTSFEGRAELSLQEWATNYKIPNFFHFKFLPRCVFYFCTLQDLTYIPAVKRAKSFKEVILNSTDHWLHTIFVKLEGV